MTHPRRRPHAVAAALAVAALGTTAAVPATASAATSGETTIELGGAVARSLRAQDVTLSARKPAKANARRITLPVSAGRLAAGATLDHRGSVSFRARTGRRTRVTTFTGWQTKVAAKRATITAKLGRRRVTLFTVTYKASARTTTSDRVALSASTVSLTPKGAQALRRGLGLRTLSAGVIGKTKVAATVDGGGTRTPAPGTGGGGNTGGGNTGGGTGGGGGGGTTPPPSTPEVRPIETEPPVLARPAGAVDVTSATITWWVRDSFTRYVYGSPSGGTTFSNGVVGGAEIAQDAHVCSDAPAASAPPLRYSFTFPFARGWYDAATQSAGIYGTGSVTFKYPEHGIDLTADDPEIELTGPAARTIMRFNGSGSTNPGNRRGILVTLATAGTTPTPGGPLLTYRGTLPTEAAGNGDIFAGFYPRGSPFGCFQVAFATS